MALIPYFTKADKRGIGDFCCSWGKLNWQIKSPILPHKAPLPSLIKLRTWLIAPASFLWPFYLFFSSPDLHPYFKGKVEDFSFLLYLCFLSCCQIGELFIDYFQTFLFNFIACFAVFNFIANFFIVVI